MPLLTSQKPYDSLPQTEAHQNDVEKERSLGHRKASVRYDLSLNFWKGATILLAIISTWLGLKLYWSNKENSFENGFHHELRAARPFIEIEEQWFEGAPRFADDGTEYVPAHGQEELRYTGEPSKEIDRNWDLLHWVTMEEDESAICVDKRLGRFFLLTEDEAREAWGAGYKTYWAPQEGGYLAALDVMHQLHCLDHLRKAYYPATYPLDSPIHGTMHREHCLDHLRQVIMCNSDLTPIPSRFYTALNDNYIDSDRPHTCRNFGKIREWVSERFNGTTAVPKAPGTEVGASEWESRLT